MIGLISKLMDVILSIIAANGDSQKEEEALLEGQEAIKAEMDRRKFGTSSTPGAV